MMNARPNPLISVVIPCLNAQETIERALVSVKKQDYQPLEIIVVDDGSTDGTGALLDKYIGEKFYIIRLDKNRGAAAARNAGIRCASGEYIAFLDADDEWLPRKLTIQMSEIREHPEMTFVACKASFVTVDGRFEEDLYLGFPPATGKEAWRTLLAYNYIATPSVLVRRTAVDAAGGFAPELIVGEDQDLWIRLALLGEVGFISEPLVIVHAQAGSLSHQASLKLLDYGLPMIMRHFRKQQHRLSRQEQRFILGHRFTKFGRLTYSHSPWKGFKLIAKAIWLGHNRMQNFRYLVAGSWPAMFLKRFIERVDT